MPAGLSETATSWANCENRALGESLAGATGSSDAMIYGGIHDQASLASMRDETSGRVEHPAFSSRHPGAGMHRPTLAANPVLRGRKRADKLDGHRCRRIDLTRLQSRMDRAPHRGIEYACDPPPMHGAERIGERVDRLTGKD